MTKKLDGFHIVNGTSYKDEAPSEVIRVLEEAKQEGKRVAITYGNTKTGAAWIKCFPARGYVSKTCDTGLPVLLYSKESSGGERIMDGSILEIRESKGNKILYEWEAVDEALVVEEKFKEEVK